MCDSCKALHISKKENSKHLKSHFLQHQGIPDPPNDQTTLFGTQESVDDTDHLMNQRILQVMEGSPYHQHLLIMESIFTAIHKPSFGINENTKPLFMFLNHNSCALFYVNDLGLTA